MSEWSADKDTVTEDKATRCGHGTYAICICDGRDGCNWLKQKAEATERLRLTKLRKDQAKRVMPLIGPLMDAWDGMPNDVKDYLEEQAERFTMAMHEIIEQMESHHYD